MESPVSPLRHQQRLIPSRGRPQTAIAISSSTGEAAAAARNWSRFREGSMNDRVSAAPPSRFLGPDAELSPSFASPTSPSLAGGGWQQPQQQQRPITRSEYESRISRSSGGDPAAISIGKNAAAPAADLGDAGSSRSGSSGGSAGSAGKGFFSRAWFDGFKSILGTGPAGAVPGRERGSQRSASADDAKIHSAAPQQQPKPAGNSGGGGGGGGPARPSREEILRGYNELMASDFFASRAIPSTRQPPPPPPPTPSSSAGPPRPKRIHFIANLSPQSQSRPQTAAAALSSDLRSPLSPSRPGSRATTAPRPSSAIFTHWTLSQRESFDVGRGSSGGAGGRAAMRHSVDGYAPLPPPTRRLKRSFGMKSRSGLGTEIGIDEEADEDETEVGRTIKRLRKSASRLSIDLSIPRLRRSGNQQQDQEHQQQEHQQQHQQRHQHQPDSIFPKPSNRFSKLVGGKMSASRAAVSEPGFGPSASSAPRTAKWAAAVARRGGGGEPLTVIPDTNRGIPTVPEIPDHFRKDCPVGRPSLARGEENIRDVVMAE